MSNDIYLNNESNDILLKIRMIDRPKMFMCIGSPRHVWDSFGPMVGSLLREDNNIICIGTMDNPVNSYNVEKTESILREKYPDHILIVVDGASTKSAENANKLWVRSGGIKPGETYSKNLREVGDYSILFSIDINDLDNKDHSNPFKAALKATKIINKILKGD